jgi:hypothetical protein
MPPLIKISSSRLSQLWARCGAKALRVGSHDSAVNGSTGELEHMQREYHGTARLVSPRFVVHFSPSPAVKSRQNTAMEVRLPAVDYSLHGR